MPKQRAIELYLDNTFEEKGFPFDSGKLKVGKKDDVQFEPICVFTERKPRRCFWRGARKLLFFVDGTVQAIRFSKTLEEFQTFWTKKESKEFVDKAIATAVNEVKPMKTWQFFVIIGLLIAIFAVLMRLATLWGAFG